MTTEPAQTTPLESGDAAAIGGEAVTPQEPPRQPFDAFGLCQQTLDALRQMHFATATGVQAAAIPPALEGHDLRVQARTGSGKTVAFGVPIWEKLEHWVLLELTPTRIRSYRR